MAAFEATYRELVRRGAGEPETDLSPDQMRDKIAAVIPQALEASRGLAQQTSARARRLQFLVSAKYCIGGSISAVLFFFVWESPRSARTFVIFSRRGDSTLTPTERVERLMEHFKFLPNLEEYSWYRRWRRRDGDYY